MDIALDLKLDFPQITVKTVREDVSEERKWTAKESAMGILSETSVRADAFQVSRSFFTLNC